MNNLPDVSFIEADIDDILTSVVREYENAYFESTGERKTLYPGDPIRIFLYTQALREFQLRVAMNDAAKQNLLAYARDDKLDGLGQITRTPRLEASSATTMMKFVLSNARPTDTVIPAGTRVSPGDDIYFSNEKDVKVPAGNTEVEFKVSCHNDGDIGNGFSPGQITILVDPIPWISGVENTTESSGGVNAEEDDDYRERIHIAPEGFSVAGPEGAYEYFARQFSSLIEDLKITSPNPGEVDIRVLLQDGELPDSVFIEDLTEYLSDKSRRPLTDFVSVGAPTTVNYDVDLTYYIRASDASAENQVKTRIEQAIDDYIIWQRSKIGRDVNPSELIGCVIQAGAKRVELTAPVFASLASGEIVVNHLKTVNYGGLEDE